MTLHSRYRPTTELNTDTCGSTIILTVDGEGDMRFEVKSLSGETASMFFSEEETEGLIVELQRIHDVQKSKGEK